MTFVFPKYILFLVFFTLIVSCSKEDDQLNNAPEVFIKTPERGFVIDVADTLMLEPQIIYDYNTSYQWFLNGVAIPEATNRILRVIPNDRYGSFLYTFIVSNSNGSDTLTVPVVALVQVDFEEFELEKDSYSIGDGGEMVRASKMVNLPVNWDVAKNRWSGFAFSNKSTTSNNDSVNQYSVYNTSGGDEESKNFLVLSGEDDKESFISFNDGKQHTIGNISLASDNYTYWSIKNGYTNHQLTPYVIPNDYLGILITGYNESGVAVKSAEIYLANYLTTNSRSSYLLASWVQYDLSLLGSVSKIGFKFYSSRTDVNGVVTPTFLCIDNIQIIE